MQISGLFILLFPFSFILQLNINTNKVYFNQRFAEFAKDCMFKPLACKPFRPCTKGLVENLAKIMDRLKVYNEEFDTYCKFALNLVQKIAQ